LKANVTSSFFLKVADQRQSLDAVENLGSYFSSYVQCSEQLLGFVGLA